MPQFAASYAHHVQVNGVPIDLSHLRIRRAYLFWIWERQVGRVWVVLALAAALRLLVKSDLRRAHGWLVAAAVAGAGLPWLFLSAMNIVAPRFFLPVVPLFGVLIAVGLFAGSDRGSRVERGLVRGASVVLVAWGVARFALLSFAPHPVYADAPWAEAASGYHVDKDYEGISAEGVAFRMTPKAAERWVAARFARMLPSGAERVAVYGGERSASLAAGLTAACAERESPCRATAAGADSPDRPDALMIWAPVFDAAPHPFGPDRPPVYAGWRRVDEFLGATGHSVLLVPKDETPRPE